MSYSTLKRACDELDFARERLDRSGETAIPIARESLERVIVLLASAATDEDLSDDARDAALGCRVVVSSHLLAADDFEAVGIQGTTLASLLRRAADSRELEAAVLNLQPSAS